MCEKDKQNAYFFLIINFNYNITLKLLWYKTRFVQETQRNEMTSNSASLPNGRYTRLIGTHRKFFFRGGGAVLTTIFMKTNRPRFLKIFSYLQIFYLTPWVSGVVVRYSRRSPAPEFCPVNPTSSKLGSVRSTWYCITWKAWVQTDRRFGLPSQGRRWMGTQQQVQTKASRATPPLESLHSTEWITAVYYQRQDY